MEDAVATGVWTVIAVLAFAVLLLGGWISFREIRWRVRQREIVEQMRRSRRLTPSGKSQVATLQEIKRRNRE